MESLKETVDLLSQDGQAADRKYDHILFYAHGGVTDAVAAARKAAAMKDGFRRNRIYPFFFIWETGMIQELGDILAGAVARPVRAALSEGFRDEMDFLLEKLTAVPGRALWREMKADATRTFADGSTSCGGEVQLLLGATKDVEHPHKVHLVWPQRGRQLRVRVRQSVAPARTSGHRYRKMRSCSRRHAIGQHFRRADAGSGWAGPVLKQLTTYDLTDTLERADTVGPFTQVSPVSGFRRVRRGDGH